MVRLTVEQTRIATQEVGSDFLSHFELSRFGHRFVALLSKQAANDGVGRLRRRSRPKRVILDQLNRIHVAIIGYGHDDHQSGHYEAHV